MCPDHPTLSAYYDGELEGEIERQVEEHVRECGECSQFVTGYELLHSRLDRLPDSEVRQAQDRSWPHIMARASFQSAVPLWKRSIQIPATLATAAVAIIMLLSLGILYTIHQPKAPDPIDLAEGLDRVVVDGSFDEIIQYLANHRGNIVVNFTFPAEHELDFLGEPELIRAADFKRVGE